MEVPRSVLDGYDSAMKTTIDAIQNELKATLSLVDYSQPIELVRRELTAIMDAYCGAASSAGARISSEFYNGLRQMATGKSGTLSLQSGRNPEATERSVRAFLQKLVKGDEEGLEELMMERVEIEAKRSAAYNTIDNVRNDPDKPRFARVPQGEKTCDFCLMLASRGPVYLTEESAGAFTKYHAHCDCKVVPFWDTVADGYSRRRSISMSIEGYDPDALYDRYKHPEKYKGEKSDGRTVGAMRYRDNRSSNVILQDRQFGHKVRTHCKDWGLDPSSEADRSRLMDIITGIIDHADEVVVGTTWRNQPQPCTFYRRGDDIVIVNANDEYVTVMKGGSSNKRFLRAREEAKSER